MDIFHILKWGSFFIRIHLTTCISQTWTKVFYSQTCTRLIHPVFGNLVSFYSLRQKTNIIRSWFIASFWLVYFDAKYLKKCHIHEWNLSYVCRVLISCTKSICKFNKHWIIIDKRIRYLTIRCQNKTRLRSK